MFRVYYFIKMKYSININQKEAIALSSKIDIIDMAIFDFIKDFAPIAKRLESDPKYFMIRWKLVAEQLPILKIKTRQGIYKRMDALVEFDVIQPHPDNQRMNGAWFKWGKSYEKLIFFERVNDGLQDVTNVYTPDNERLHPVSTTIYTPVNVGLHNKNTSHKSTIEKITTQKIIDDLMLPFDEPEFIAAWNKWEKYRREIKHKLTPSTAAAQLKKLSQYDYMTAIAFIERTIEKGWRGIVYELDKSQYNGKQNNNRVDGGGTIEQFNARNQEYKKLD